MAFQRITGSRLALLASVALAVSGGSAAAKAVYKYVGQDYTYTYPSNGCLTNTMFVRMSLTLPSPLVPNMNNQTVQATAWTINDGVNTYKSSPKVDSTMSTTFSTDSAGKITAWSLKTYFYLNGNVEFNWFSGNTSADYVAEYAGDTKCMIPNIGASSVAGTWKVKK